MKQNGGHRLSLLTGLYIYNRFFNKKTKKREKKATKRKKRRTYKR